MCRGLRCGTLCPTMLNSSPRCRFALAGVIAMTSGAMAQSQAPEGADPGPPPGPDVQAPSAPPSTPREPVSGARTLTEREAMTIRLLGGGEIAFNADLDDSPGDLSVYRAAAGLEMGVPVGERARLSMLFFGERSWYDFDNATGIVPGTDDPLDEAYRLVLRPLLSWQIDQQWGVFGAASLNWAAEDGGELADAFTVTGFGGARYAFSEELSLSFGVGASTQLEDSTEFFPILGVDWKINERTRLSTTGVEGLGARLTHGFAPEWALLVQGSYENREFRLADDNALSEGVMRERRVPLGVGLSYSPTSKVSVELMGGVIAWEELRFDDRDGNEISEINADPAPFIRLMVRVQF